MKFSAVVLAAVLGTAAAGKPQLSISIRDGEFGGLDGLDPTLTWETSSSSKDMDISYGIEAAAIPTTDIASLPRRVWGKASTSISGWGVTTSMESEDMEGATFDIDAENKKADMTAKLSGSTAGGLASASVTKSFDANGGTVTVTPSINLETDEKDVALNYDNDGMTVTLTASSSGDRTGEVTYTQDDVSIKVAADAAGSKTGEVTYTQDALAVTLAADSDGSKTGEVTYTQDDLSATLTADADGGREGVLTYSKDDTELTLTADANGQEVTISQQIDKDNKISPTINSNGDISVAWDRTISSDSSISAVLKPNDSLNIEWVDDAWTANIDCPVDGTDVKGASVHVKRDVSF